MFAAVYFWAADFAERVAAGPPVSPGLVGGMAGCEQFAGGRRPPVTANECGNPFAESDGRLSPDRRPLLVIILF